MLVQQIYVGWTGVKIGGWCANATTNFQISSVSMDKQLRVCIINKKEVDALITGIKGQENFPNKDLMLEYLKKLESR